jgi:hypothetical protein
MKRNILSLSRFVLLAAFASAADLPAATPVPYSDATTQAASPARHQKKHPKRHHKKHGKRKGAKQTSGQPPA